MPLYTTTPSLNAAFRPLNVQGMASGKTEKFRKKQKIFLKVAVYPVILPWVIAWVSSASICYSKRALATEMLTEKKLGRTKNFMFSNVEKY